MSFNAISANHLKRDTLCQHNSAPACKFCRPTVFLKGMLVERLVAHVCDQSLRPINSQNLAIKALSVAQNADATVGAPASVVDFLKVAIKEQDERIVALFLQYGVDPNLSGTFQIPLLYVAAYENAHKIVALLLRFGADPNLPSSNAKQTPLMVSSAKCAQLLIEAGADVSAVNSDGNTALHLAVMQRRPQPLIRVLLQGGIAVNVTNKQGKTAHQLAESTLICRLIDEYSKRSDAEDSSQQPVVDVPKKDGTDDTIVLCKHTGNTATNQPFRVTYDAFASIVRANADDGGCIFVEANKVLDEIDGNMRHDAVGKLLAEAVHCREHIFVSLLLAAGADPNSVMPNGIPILNHVLEKQPTMALTSQLIDFGADVNRVDKNFRTPLYLVSGWQNGSTVDVAKKLIEHGADPNVPVTVRSGVETCLSYATSMGNLAMVRVLLDAGANVNRLTRHGHTSLYFAIRGNHVSIAACLVEAGAIIKQSDRDLAAKSQLAASFDAIFNVPQLEVVVTKVDEREKPFVHLTVNVKAASTNDAYEAIGHWVNARQQLLATETGSVEFEDN